MAPARVLFVNHTSTISGAELVLLDIIKGWQGASAFLFEKGPLNTAMTERGVAVTTSRCGRGLSGIKRDTNLFSALPLGGRLAGLAGELCVAARRADVLYANSQKAFVVGAVAAAISRRPLIWHLHDIISGAHFGAAQRRLQIGLANRFAKKVVVPSQSAAEAFTEAGGKPGLVSVVVNGLEIGGESATGSELRAALGLPSGPLIGVFSRLAPWKGQHVVLRALADLPHVKCVFAGTALFGEDQYAECLKALVEKLGLADRVTFLGQRSDVPRLMRAVDVVVHPSVDPEPFGRTLVEAMLVRTPVIATDAGAASEILDGGRAGTLVPPGDSVALAAAVQAVLARPDAVALQIEIAEARAHKEYGVEVMRRSVGDIVDTVWRRNGS